MGLLHHPHHDYHDHLDELSQPSRRADSHMTPALGELASASVQHFAVCTPGVLSDHIQYYGF